MSMALNPNLQYPLAMLGLGKSPADFAQQNGQLLTDQQNQQQARLQQLQALQGMGNATSMAPTMSPMETLARALSGGMSGALWNKQQQQQQAPTMNGQPTY